MLEQGRFDVVVVGGGPAGLSAALVLGRSRLRVALVDGGTPRNARARELHTYLGRDGVPPLDLLQAGREEVARYGVAFHAGEATAVRREASGFRVHLAGGERLRCRRLLLATGVVDPLPRLEGIEELYGISVHHCPFCDGWEHRDERLAVYGRGAAGARFAVKLTRWSPDVVLITGGPSRLRLGERQLLEQLAIPVRSEPIARLEGSNGKLRRVVFAEGEPLERDALFFGSRPRQRCDLAAALGCRFTNKGVVHTNHLQEAGVPGLYVAGDASRDVQLAIVAAAEGTKAGVAIVGDLERERLAVAGTSKRSGSGRAGKASPTRARRK
jgi:thioredoxin reductase